MNKKYKITINLNENIKFFYFVCFIFIFYFFVLHKTRKEELKKIYGVINNVLPLSMSCLIAILIPSSNQQYTNDLLPTSTDIC